MKKNTTVDANMIKEGNVDAVVIAIGANPIEIPIEGMDTLPHASAPEVLRHEVCPKGRVAVIGGGLVGLETADTLASEIPIEGMDTLPHASAPEVLRHEVCPKGRVAVIGGGLVGLETADTLASEGCQVTILEMKDAIGSDLGSLRKIAVMMKMAQLQVDMRPNSRVCKFTNEGIVLEDGSTVACDFAVFAVGYKAKDSEDLVQACQDKDIPCYVMAAR